MRRIQVLTRTVLAATLGACLAVGCAAPPEDMAAQNAPAAPHWVGTWSTALVSQPAASGPPRPGVPSAPDVANRTLREIVRVSIGGPSVRIVVSNLYGAEDLNLGGASVAKRASEGQIQGNAMPVTFSGREAMLIPVGASIVSDPVRLDVAPLTDLVVDLFVASTPTVLTTHSAAMQTNYVSEAGNHVGAATLPGATTVASWYFLARVDVESTSDAIVTFGDSITDGTGSTLDANARWPNFLAGRLAESPDGPMGVLNAGIAGNRVLTDGLGVNALARFDREVLAQPGVTHVFVLMGINDFGLGNIRGFGFPARDPAATADDVIAGYKQLIARAHARGLTIWGATLTPFEGTTIPGYFTPEGEVQRQAVNAWIRTSGAFDGVVDFDEVIRDPEHPTQMQAQYNSGDSLHPNDAGYAAMANAIDMAMLRQSVGSMAVATQ